MLYYTILHYTMLYYTMLYYTMLYYAIPYYTISFPGPRAGRSPALRFNVEQTNQQTKRAATYIM